MSRTRYVATATVSFIVLLGAWQLATTRGMVDALFLPSPADVLATLWDQAVSGELWEDIKVSVTRIAMGYALATVMALPLGLLMGSYRVWEAAVEPFVDFIRYMPVVAFVPLTILWVGTEDPQKWLIIWIGTFFQQVLLLMDTSRRVPADFIDLGRTLGMVDGQILRRIVLPASAPGVWDTLRISLGWAWTWLVLAELVAATTGLGYRITTAQRFFNTDLIIGYVIVLGVLGLVTDQIMRAMGRRFFRYEEAKR